MDACVCVRVNIAALGLFPESGRDRYSSGHPKEAGTVDEMGFFQMNPEKNTGSQRYV